MHEGFIGERIVRLSKTSLGSCARDEINRCLYPSSFGYFPKAEQHRVTRADGHPHHTLLFCCSGKGYARLGSQSQIIAPFQVFWISQGQSHQYGADPEFGYWEKYWVHFTGSYSNLYIEKFNKRASDSRLQINHPSVLEQSFKELISLGEGPHTPHRLLLMHHALGQVMYRILNEGIPCQDEAQKVNNSMEDIIHWLDQSYASDIKLNEMQARSESSQATFFRQFKRHTGLSPLQYLTQVRIQKACQLLDLSSKSISDIGQAVGFHDPLYFSRVFSKIMGMSPQLFRKNR
jgi:AraC-like DNA-binding protein